MKPVYIINGFLESGKTEFIVYTLAQPYFQLRGKTLLVLCEEGEVEYDEKLLKDSKTILERMEEEADFTWFAEFADFTDDSPDKKSVVRLQIRLELDEGASCKALIRYDSVGDWEQAGAVMETDVKRSRILPLIPRRADHYRLRLEGKGGGRVYAITRSYDPGSELKSR